MVEPIIAYSLSASLARCSKNPLPYTTVRPSIMTAGDVVPVSETLRQVAPQNTRALAVNDGLDKLAVILRRGADRVFAAG